MVDIYKSVTGTSTENEIKCFCCGWWKFHWCWNCDTFICISYLQAHANHKTWAKPFRYSCEPPVNILWCYLPNRLLKPFNLTAFRSPVQMYVYYSPVVFLNYKSECFHSTSHCCYRLSIAEVHHVSVALHSHSQGDRTSLWSIQKISSKPWGK